METGELDVAAGLPASLRVVHKGTRNLPLMLEVHLDVARHDGTCHPLWSMKAEEADVGTLVPEVIPTDDRPLEQRVNSKRDSDANQR
jgi:hypothetical protein